MGLVETGFNDLLLDKYMQATSGILVGKNAGVGDLRGMSPR
jgi:hypothetical protein